MKQVWVAFPSCNAERAAVCCAAWIDAGYHTCVTVDDQATADMVSNKMGDHGWPHVLRIVSPYPGYWRSQNEMARLLVEKHDAEVVICGADDIYPDERANARELHAEFVAEFPDLFGIMQPTGDAAAMPGTDKICGSPWIGRAVVERLYHGAGPYWPDYMQFYGDEELHDVADMLGILRQRSDVTQKHLHWARRDGQRTARLRYQEDNSTRWWKQDQGVFMRRKSEGFPGHEAR